MRDAPDIRIQKRLSKYNPETEPATSFYNNNNNEIIITTIIIISILYRYIHPWIVNRTEQ